MARDPLKRREEHYLMVVGLVTAVLLVLTAIDLSR